MSFLIKGKELLQKYNEILENQHKIMFSMYLYISDFDWFSLCKR